VLVVAVLAAPALAAGRSVAVDYEQFRPSTITINVGDTITWTNVDPARFDHDVTFASFGSGTLKPKASYKHTFLKAGTFGYRCTIHANTAKVVVTAPSTPPPTRRPTPKPTPTPTPRPTPSPSPTPSPTMSASPTSSASTAATQTSTATAPPSAIAILSTSTAPSPAGQGMPVADTGAPNVVLILVIALVVAGAVGLGARAARRH
jgi:plastocyanin